jgi:formylglycine-generating enzyme required for sulfatase activity
MRGRRSREAGAVGRPVFVVVALALVAWSLWFLGDIGSDPARSEKTPAPGSKRVMRGGSWNSRLPWSCRSAVRSAVEPSYAGDNIGFRPARTP